MYYIIDVTTLINKIYYIILKSKSIIIISRLDPICLLIALKLSIHYAYIFNIYYPYYYNWFKFNS